MSDEPKNPEDMSPDELKAAMLAETPAVVETPVVPETPETPEALETPAEVLETYTAADGTVYSAKTKDELWTKVTGALNHSKEALKDRERQIHELKPPKDPAETEEYDHNKWLELASVDAREAAKYVDKFRPEVQRTQQVIAQTEEQRRVSDAVLTFHRDVPDYAAVETPEVTAAFTARLKTAGRAVTADNLKLTYFELKEAGTIPAAPAPVTRKKAPPRSPDGGGGPTTPTIDPEAMSKEELRKYINEHAVH